MSPAAKLFILYINLSSIHLNLLPSTDPSTILSVNPSITHPFNVVLISNQIPSSHSTTPALYPLINFPILCHHNDLTLISPSVSHILVPGISLPLRNQRRVATGLLRGDVQLSSTSPPSTASCFTSTVGVSGGTKTESVATWWCVSSV